MVPQNPILRRWSLGLPRPGCPICALFIVICTADKDSATSQFFLNVADNAFLDHGQRDFGYAVFGKIVKGMDVADKISQVPTHDVGPYQNVPSKPVVILSAKVLP